MGVQVALHPDGTHPPRQALLGGFGMEESRMQVDRQI